MKKNVAGLMALTIASLPAAASAEDNSSVFTLGEITSTASAGTPENSSSEVISGDEMRQFNADTIDEALLLTPGTSLIKRGQRNETSVYIRGFDARQVPVLVDGIPVYVPYDGYVDMGRFTTWDVSEIQVTKGMTSVLNGPNAMGGVVNLVSRHPEKAAEGEVRGKASFDGNGAFNGWESAINAGSKIDQVWMQGGLTYSDKSHYRLSDNWNGPGRYVENGGNRENSSMSDYKFNLKAGWNPRDKDEYAINLISQSGDKDAAPNATDAVTASGQRRPWRWPAWDKNSLYWLSNTGFADSGYVKTRVYYDSFKNRLDEYTDYTYSKVANSSWYRDYTVGASAEVGGDLNSWNSLKGAVHYKEDTHREKADQLVRSGSGTSLVTPYSEPWQKTSDETWSLGVEDTVHLTPQWDVVGGASYDMRFAGRSDDYNWKLPNKVYQVGGKDSKVLNPQLGTTWHFSDSGDAHAIVAHRSRFPSLKDMYSQSFGTKLQNPDLVPEKVITYEVGAGEQFWGHTRFSGNAFYNDIRDSIESIAVSSSVSQNQNVGNATSYGYELSVNSHVLPNWELGGNYTYTHSWNELLGRRMLGVPLHKVMTYARYDVQPDWWVQGDVTTQTGMLSLGQNSVYSDAYTLVNLKTHWDITSSLSGEVGINNLFDANYEPNPGYPEEGRNYFVGMRATF